MIRVEGDRLMLSGSITMDNASKLFKQGSIELKKQALTINLSEVDSVDSSAVSLLISWSRLSQSLKQELKIEHHPEDLISLLDLYDVDEFLPQAST